MKKIWIYHAGMVFLYVFFVGTSIWKYGFDVIIPLSFLALGAAGWGFEVQEWNKLRQEKLKQ